MFDTICLFIEQVGIIIPVHNDLEAQTIRALRHCDMIDAGQLCQIGLTNPLMCC